MLDRASGRGANRRPGPRLHKVFEELVDGVEPIKKPKGRLRKRPDKLHDDKGYDYPRCRKLLRKRGAASTRVRGWAVTAGSWSAR